MYGHTGMLKVLQFHLMTGRGSLNIQSNTGRTQIERSVLREPHFIPLPADPIVTSG